jgi:Rrf2 family iron-sulfur cluster assembly transcriptional regulator
MRITTKGRYALRAITNLALSRQDKPKPIKDIAAEEEISPEFLEQIFFRLRKAGIISSVRGPGGGFSMKSDPKDVSVKDIFEAVGEGLWLTPCTSDDPDSCERKDSCLVHDVWEEASTYILGYFERLTLAKIMADSKGNALSQLVEGGDFSLDSEAHEDDARAAETGSTPDR